MSEENSQGSDRKTKRSSSSRRKAANRSANDILRIMTRDKHSSQDEVKAQPAEKIEDTRETTSKSDANTTSDAQRQEDRIVVGNAKKMTRANNIR